MIIMTVLTVVVLIAVIAVVLTSSAEHVESGVYVAGVYAFGRVGALPAI